MKYIILLLLFVIFTSQAENTENTPNRYIGLTKMAEIISHKMEYNYDCLVNYKNWPIMKCANGTSNINCMISNTNVDDIDDLDDLDITCNYTSPHLEFRNKKATCFKNNKCVIEYDDGKIIINPNINTGFDELLFVLSYSIHIAFFGALIMVSLLYYFCG